MKPSRTFIIFYVVVLYVFASYVWWAFLLIDKNEQLYNQQVGVSQLEYNIEHGLPYDSEEFYSSEMYNNLIEKENRQYKMIFGEGLVFLIILAIATIQLYRTIKKEMSLVRQQNNFLLSITHELKSPLSSIRLSLETLLSRVKLEDKFKRLVNNSINDTDRLVGLVDNILTAAKMENSSYSFHLEVENISELAESIIDRINSKLTGKTTISKKLEADLYAKVDSFAFSSAVINLIENAVKYSPADKQIDIELKSEDNNLILEVKDQGLGILDEDKKKVFKKFYRVGNEETRTTKGTGLGLFIVKSVIVGHGGKISVKDNKPTGSVFKINIPLA